MNSLSFFKALNRIVLVFVIMTVCSAWAVELGQAPLVDDAILINNQIIVQYTESLSLLSHGDVSLAEKKAQRKLVLNRFAQKTGVSLSVIREINALTSLIELKKPITKAELGYLIAVLESDPQIKYAEPDVRFQAMGSKGSGIRIQ